jgi:thiol-disulfide isomerase/thioredoxin
MVLTPSKEIPLGIKIPDFTLPPVSGGNVSVEDFSDSKVLVVAFICNHCPYVKHTLPGFIDLVNDYLDGGVSFLAINSNDAKQFPEDSFEKMKEYAQTYDYPFVYAYDELQEVAKAFKATCTPDFFVFNNERELVYHGQMDGSRPSNKIPVTGEDLRQAIDETLAGEPVSLEQKHSIGCNIKWKDSNFSL